MKKIKLDVPSPPIAAARHVYCYHDGLSVTYGDVVWQRFDSQGHLILTHGDGHESTVTPGYHTCESRADREEVPAGDVADPAEGPK